MKFEWDTKKSSSNKEKHGIDFETARELWRDENCIEIHLPNPIEEREVVIGKIQNKLWTAIYTHRNEAIRIISVRRARKKEVELYGNEKKG